MKFLKNLFQFLKSKTFLIQLIIAVALFVIICFVALEWLESSTNHNQQIVVPSLSKRTLDEVEEVLTAKNLRYEVQDSTNYNPDYPKYSVIDQNPPPGNTVKENRKIYVTLNPSGYRKIEVPSVTQQTRRQVEPKLIALGFKIGKITYQPHMSDQVLELRYKGKKIKPGDKLMKTATIDLVVGDQSGKSLNLSGDSN
ncbi:PASTA domain-containing protein [Aquimarina sp. ERC-38]|uniref:PASTA domain-containing protein n=1 Tax=Aquimarina sp. ERC-38 TaxID=2949996 RepID=UPI002245D541|nr:PASTA domain-containing protein [Aquimarina sp. ERC-38]UZO80541.1 PASTA domain-containing protein [Aquimarina sp. ERC-38]